MERLKNNGFENKKPMEQILASAGGSLSMLNRSPLGLLAVVAVSIFVVESIAMYILMYLPQFPAHTEMLIDSFILTVLISPVLYYFLFRPLALYINKNNIAQKELERYHNGLLTLVEERTAKLQSEVEERTKAEESLKESEGRLREAQCIAKLGSWELDLVANELYWSDEIYRIFNMEPQEFKATYEAFLATVHPEDREYVNQVYNDSVKSRTDYDIVHRLLMKNGAVKYVNEKCLTEYDKDGKPLRSIGTTQDITERRSMEHEANKAQKLESVGILAGGIAHDFNNLLTGILANVSLAKIYSTPEEKVYKRLVEAENAAEHAAKLAQQLLTFSKGGEPVKQVSCIKGPIKDSASLALRGSNVSCEYALQKELWLVEIDLGQFNQVINNLAINARHALPQGGVLKISAVNIEVGEENKSVGISSLMEGRYLKISVEDGGVGIGRDHLDKVFDPYFTTKGDGSGLGLATSYSIIEKHGGYITVESQLGIGTTFHIYLPASEKEASGDKTRADIIKGSSKEHEGIRVLVMDDEEIVREVAREILTSLGHVVDFAIDGKEAIRLYRNAKESGTPFNVVITDLTIPGGMGGKEMIKRLLEYDPEVKAIVSSGYSNDPVIANYREYGFSGVVTKPYKAMELGTMVHQVITVEN